MANNKACLAYLLSITNMRVNSKENFFHQKNKIYGNEIYSIRNSYSTKIVFSQA